MAQPILKTNQIPEFISDEEMSRLETQGRVSSEFLPESPSLPDTGPIITKEQFEIKGPLGVAGRLFGPEKVGRFIGAQAARLFPEHRKVLGRLEEAEEKGFAEPGTTEIIRTGGVTPKEAIFSGIRTGMSLALPFASKFLTPSQVGMKAAMLNSSVTGAAFSSVGTIEEKPDASLGEVRNAAITGAIIGAMFPPLMKGAEAVGGFLKGMPRRMYSTIFKETKEDILRELQAQVKGKDIMTTSEWALTGEKLAGGLRSMGQETIKRTNNIEQQIQQQVSGKTLPLPVNKKVFINALSEIEKQYRSEFPIPPIEGQAGKILSTAQEAGNLINQFKQSKGNTISQELALQTKRFLDQLRSRPSFKHPANPLSARQESLKNGANLLRQGLKNANPKIKTLLEREMHLINMREDIVDAMVRMSNKQLLNLTDILLGGGGLAGGFPGGGIGAAFGIRLFQRPEIMTALAQGMQRYTIGPAERLFGQQITGGMGTIGQQIQPTARQIFFGKLGQ